MQQAISTFDWSTFGNYGAERAYLAARIDKYTKEQFLSLATANKSLVSDNNEVEFADVNVYKAYVIPAPEYQSFAWSLLDIAIEGCIPCWVIDVEDCFEAMVDYV